MWFLQRRNMHKQYLIVPVGLGITLLHAGLLGLLFFVYRDTIEHLNLTIIPSLMARDIEFRVAIERGARKGQATGKAAPGVSTKNAPAAKKMAGPVTKIGALPAAPAKKAVPKKGVQKNEKKKESAVPVKKVAEKPVPKKEPVKEPVVEKKQQVSELPKVAESAAPAQQLPEHLDLAVGKEGVIEGADSTLVFFEAEYRALYENLSDQWAPPAGVPAQSQCTITIVLDRDGEIDDMLVDNSSGMLVFDVAARAALSEVEFPRFAWGKSITVTFSV